MGNVSSTPEKVARRRWMFQQGIRALEENGWTVKREPRSGKSSVRRIEKGSESKLATIRTSQDGWIAFPRNKSGTGWGTLEGVDLVVAVSVNDLEDPKFAQVHFIGGDEMRDRFDRAYSARKDAGHDIPADRGMWVSLYLKDTKEPVYQVGAGAGLDNFVLRERLPLETPEVGKTDQNEGGLVAAKSSETDKGLTIEEAKKGLALTFGVSASNIRITVEA